MWYQYQDSQLPLPAEREAWKLLIQKGGNLLIVLAMDTLVFELGSNLRQEHHNLFRRPAEDISEKSNWDRLQPLGLDNVIPGTNLFLYTIISTRDFSILWLREVINVDSNLHNVCL